MAKVITLGEIMLRLSTPGQSRFVQAESFDVVYGGGEANVAVSLANYGHKAHFVTKLPTHEIGQSAINALRRYGVHTDYIVRGGERVGIYYLETGASMRPSKVIYDRANSAIALAKANEFNFDEIFKDADWFHFSGITPALSKEAAELTKQALIAAKKNNVMVSVDLNYRKKLWTPDEARSVMRPLMEYVDVCIGNEEDADLTLGFKPKNTDVTGGKLNIDAYKDIFKEMAETFNFKMVGTSLRESHSATHNGWSILLYDGNDFYHSKKYEINPIIDRVGGGDSFSGGLIHGLLTRTPKEAVEFAAAASALKHTIPGDFNQVSESEVDNLSGGDQSGRVQR
ncbi:sugar kinase [Acholeplasma granularum]|uniref:sugar kinase n=1 Tax=Acholeplasma granularum TaxID=264635 RepID=UPI0004BA675F|nr:sugar kinase [Acholeplasma granularum]